MPNPEPLHFCLLIPCYNNFKGLVQSLNSIEYDEPHYKIVIVDDGSEEPLTLEGIQPALRRPLPLRLIRYPQNRGITHALNTGLEWIVQHTNAAYIARLDCSDICHPQRFYQQVRYMDAHPDIGIMGSWCYFESEDGSIRYRYTTPTQHEDLKKAMALRNVFIHPTVMFRTHIVKMTGYYPYTYPQAEDYALFWKMLNNTKGVVLDQYLVTCAINKKGLSLSNRNEQLRSREKVVATFCHDYALKLLGIWKLRLLRLVPQRLLLLFKSS